MRSSLAAFPATDGGDPTFTRVGGVFTRRHAGFLPRASAPEVGNRPRLSRDEGAAHAVEGRGYVLSTATSKSESSAIRLLKHFDMFDYFDVIAAASDDGSRRRKAGVVGFALAELEKLSIAEGWEMPAREDLLMIGDRIHDIEGAREFGIPVVIVGWGYGSDEERAQADFVVETPEELRHLVNEKTAGSR